MPIDSMALTEILVASLLALAITLRLFQREWTRRRKAEADSRALRETLMKQMQEQVATDQTLKDERISSIEATNSRLAERAQQEHTIADQTMSRLIRHQLVTSALAETTTSAQVIDIVINQGMEILGAVAGSISLLSADGSHLEMLDAIGYPMPIVDEYRSMALDGVSPIATAIREKRPVWIGSPQQASDSYAMMLTIDPTRKAWATIPMSVGGKIMGGLALSFADPQRFDETDKAFILALTQKCANALERIRLYAEIRDQREQFLVTLSSIADAVISTDMAGHITFMNKAAEVLTAWISINALGLELRRVVRIINETTREEVVAPLESVVFAGRGSDPDDHTMLVLKDGSEIPIGAASAPIRDAQNNIKGSVLVLRDITQRRRQETTIADSLQRAQDLYQTCHQIGMVYEAQDILHTFFSSRYLKQAAHGFFVEFDSYWNGTKPNTYTPLASLNQHIPIPALAEDKSIENSLLFSVFAPPDYTFINDVTADPRLAEDLRAELGQRGVASLILYPLIGHGNAPGQCYGLLAAYFPQPIPWQSADYQHIGAMVDQISVALENINLLSEEKRARTEAEEANAARLKFLAMMSHELRTPLTSIKGFATTLLATDVQWESQQQHEFIKIIDEEADKLSELIEQLLDLSRLQAGVLYIHAEPRRLGDVLQSERSRLETVAANHHLITMDSTGLPFVMVDPQRIGQVFVNLVGNAVKYSPVGTNISISFSRLANAVQVNIRDEGAGVPPRDRERIFTAFSQLDRTAEQKSNGVGLGLAICKGLIEAHGGTIWIADTPPPGTTVCFTIPIAAIPGLPNND